jgi:hypothetical protein
MRLAAALLRIATVLLLFASGVFSIAEADVWSGYVTAVSILNFIVGIKCADNNSSDD